MGIAFDLIINSRIDVLFAPPCIDGLCLTLLFISGFLGAVLASHVGTYYNLPVMLWGSGKAIFVC
jgi:hypothetical protein